MYPTASLRYCLEEYLTICIVTLIKLQSLDFSNWFETLSSTFAIVLGLGVLIFPFWIWINLYMKYQVVNSALESKMQQGRLRRFSVALGKLIQQKASGKVDYKYKTFKRRYKTLVDGITHRYKEAYLYSVIFVLRRTALAVIIIVIPGYAWLQTQLMIFSCSIVLLLIG